MLTASFGLNNNSAGWSQSFAAPFKTLAAHRLEEVVPILEAASAAAESGQYVALMLAYEAAPALDSALTTHPSSDFPLAWAAFFRDPVQSPSEFGSYRVDQWRPQIDRAQYHDAVATIREYIAKGDTYQVNYSFPLTSKFSGDSFAWYRDLCEAQGAAYCAFLSLGRYQILSLSPELFFERKGDVVRTKPMKGTVSRGRYTVEDEFLANWLRSSTKDRAENVMIVDLLRNDLGKVSQLGTVSVTDLFDLERFQTVWQMTSTVRSTLENGISLAQLMCALFPCGSVTGAPKIRTMQIIRKLERFPRGTYTGTIGLIQPGGNCTFNVAIRTLVLDSHTGLTTFGVGGGVTFDSTAEREYEECVVKSNFLMHAHQKFELFESILLEEGELFLFERHMKRIRESADFFGFPFPNKEIIECLTSIAAAHPSGTWKVRLSLSRNGEFRLGVDSIDESSSGPKRVAFASRPIDSSNRLFFHKTTCRDFYSAQLDAHPDCDDVVFWNERGEITESTIANVVVPLGGQLATPPIEAGLLAGTFRNHLIAEGAVVERTITIEELKTVPEFFLVNSVRRWMKVTLGTELLACAG